MTMTLTAHVEQLRSSLHAAVDSRLDELIARLAPDTAAAPATPVFKSPTIEDGHDPRNKSGQNLTSRGEEIAYRLFDESAGYNRVARMLDITPNAAKHRKAMWIKRGGLGRTKLALDIDAP